MPLIGHEKQRDYLRKRSIKDTLFPVMIFHGPSGIGKKQVALELIKENYCASSPPCEECPQCQKIARLEHENLFYIEPEGKFIKIDKIRELLRTLSLKVIEGKRFIIIDACEKLNMQSANALLKTLEEPPEKTYFILITSNYNSLLETIRSRAASLPFTSLKEDKMIELSNEALPWMLKASQGRPGLLQDLKESEAIEDRKMALDILKSCFLESRYEAFQKIKTCLQANPQWDRVFFFMQSFLRDMKVFNIEENKIINSDQMDFIKKCSQLDSHFLDSWFQLSQNLQNQFLANQDKNLCLENFWLESKQKYVNLTP